MKLKEKLAENYVEPFSSDFDEVPPPGYVLDLMGKAYLAGFESARDAIYNHIRQLRNKAPYEYAPYNEIYIDTLNDLLHTGSSCNIVNIGESEAAE